MQFVYLNNFYEKEECALRECGIPCIRISYPFIEDINIPKCTTVFRGPKMTTVEYSKLLNKLENTNCSVLVGIGDFEKISDAIEYSRCFGIYAPKVITFDVKQNASEISSLLSNSELKYPLFVRSNLESAAKYVGVSACILDSPAVNDIQTVLKPIHEYISDADTIIMKEIVPVKKIDGKNIEYRAIVINGKIVCFDYEDSSGLPEPLSLSCSWQFIDCIKLANKNGLHGAYFVDFGINEDGTIFVVECKNIINGTIKNITSFAEGLSKMVKD